MRHLLLAAAALVIITACSSCGTAPAPADNFDVTIDRILNSIEP